MKTAQETDTRKAYHRPEIKDYGKINQITASGGTVGRNDHSVGSSRT